MKKDNIFDPDLLNTLVTLAETRSFTEAARVLKRSQSTVSASIGRLEEVVGCRLVNRTTRNVSFTNDGEEMVRYARLVGNLADEALRRFAQPNWSGVVRLGLFTDFNSALLPEVFGAFHDAHPSVQLCVETNRSDILLSRMRDGGLDLALVTRLPGHGFGPPLWQDELVWIGTGEVPRQIRVPVPLAVRIKPAMLRRVGVEALNVARRPHIITFEGNSYSTVAAAVGAGMGFSVFPKSIRPVRVPIVEHGRLPALGWIDVVLLRSDADPREGVGTLHAIIERLSPQLFENAAASMFGHDQSASTADIGAT